NFFEGAVCRIPQHQFNGGDSPAGAAGGKSFFAFKSGLLCSAIAVTPYRQYLEPGTKRGLM
ncbi:MAG: hypothetical protein KAW12_22600, partial [Candidatus Aminicenantes bacterium]|nr:hypothetical protein [Candidatus Aminicenantes bacterium]